MLGRITIGDDVSIGANAVVLIDVPRACLAVGVPAVIKTKQSARSELAHDGTSLD